MNREELVKALRGYEGMCHPCSAEKYCKAGVYECQTQYCLDAADLLENDQRHAEALMAEIESLRNQLETVAAERDAAVKDLESAGLCNFCRHWSSEKCLKRGKCNWQWSGPQKEA